MQDLLWQYSPHQVSHITVIPVGNDSLEVVDSFCYLGDVSGQSGGCFDAITARVRSAWKNFRDLLPNRSFSLSVRGSVYNSCVRSALLYGSETWAVKVENINRLTRNNNSMIRWFIYAKLSDRKSMSETLSWLVGSC